MYLVWIGVRLSVKSVFGSNSTKSTNIKLYANITLCFKQRQAPGWISLSSSKHNKLKLVEKHSYLTESPNLSYVISHHSGNPSSIYAGKE